MSKLIKIGVNFRQKKINPVLKEWKSSGYPLIWKKRFENDTTIQRSCKLTKSGNYRRTCIRNIKRKVYDVYTKPKLFLYKKTEYDKKEYV